MFKKKQKEIQMILAQFNLGTLYVNAMQKKWRSDRWLWLSHLFTVIIQMYQSQWGTDLLKVKHNENLQ